MCPEGRRSESQAVFQLPGISVLLSPPATMEQGRCCPTWGDDGLLEHLPAEVPDLPGSDAAAHHGPLVLHRWLKPGFCFPVEANT